MRKKIELKNQYALAVYLLWENYYAGVTMADACKDFFHKFTNRLRDVEKLHPKMKISRLPITKKNRFGHACNFIRFKSNAPRPYLVNLIKLLNKSGLK